MTLNGVMVVTLRYFAEFGKPALQHITASICGRIYTRVYVFCSACTMLCTCKLSLGGKKERLRYRLAISAYIARVFAVGTWGALKSSFI